MNETCVCVCVCVCVQRKKQLAFTAVAKWRQRLMRNKLREEIVQMIPLVDEANALCEVCVCDV